MSLDLNKINGLMKNVYDFSVKASKTKCSDYRNQTKAM